MLNAFEETGEAFFLMIAKAFLGRMENDLFFRGGTDEQIIAVMDKNLHATKKVQKLRAGNEPLNRAFDRYSENIRQDIFKFNMDYRINAASGRRAQLLQNPEYKAVIDKYR